MPKRNKQRDFTLIVFLHESLQHSRLVYANGKLVGSELIGQYWTPPQYFHGRPSAAVDTINGTPVPYAADNSAASNAGPTNASYIQTVQQRVAALKKENPDAPAGPVPNDLVTASGSGLDPDISPAAAFYQAPRIAKARRLSLDQVNTLINDHIQSRFLWIFGEEHVNVLDLNLAYFLSISRDLSVLLGDFSEIFCSTLPTKESTQRKRVLKRRSAEEKSMPTTYQPGQLIDHYQIVHLLAHGRESTVYLARETQSQQEVVLKFPHVGELGSADVFARYQREVAIGKHLGNLSGIQHLLSPDEPRSNEYLVLNYLHGHTLREEMQERGPELLPVDEALRIVLPVARTLVVVHAQGVLHRDIKPENILLCEHGQVVLLDFGIAQWLGERWLRLRGFSTPIGTPAYMAPELLRAKAGTVQSDIYAVGVLLYELLCGHTPFQEHNTFDLLNDHLSHDPPALLEQNPAIAPALATIVMRAIRRDPGQRYPSMKVLSEDLTHLDRVRPQLYLPDVPLVGGRFRPILTTTLIILLVFLIIVAFGALAQFAHPALK